MNQIVAYLPHVNAALNSLATLLLVAGFVAIKQRREIAHRNLMLAAFGTSVVFLASYLTYHAVVGSVAFGHSHGPTIRTIYLAVLIPHIILAATVPFLAVATISTGLRDQRRWHLRLAKFTFPIWLYVSVSGVVVYLMLYVIYPDPSRHSKMPERETVTSLED